MKRVAILIIFSLFCFTVHAQSGYIKVSKGKVVEGDFFKSKIFMLKNFTNAVVKFSNGEVYEAKMNISALSQTLRFINPSGDTLAAVDEKMISSVSSGRLLFFKVNNQYVQILNTDGETSLGLTRNLNIGAESLAGAYGGKNEVSSIQKIEVFDYEKKIEKVVSDATLFFDYRENLFIVHKGKLFLFTKRNLQKFYPKQKAFIEEFYSTHSVNQNNNAEIISLYSQIVSYNR
ncbi:MAG: hypothetical protein ACD_77C00360G0003 [uncultured bacterium]|nr:MAG: hypothetical protein ACD_77C00360G0003 [uncultured bacterium]